MGVTDDSVGLEMEREVAEGSDGAEIYLYRRGRLGHD